MAKSYPSLTSIVRYMKERATKQDLQFLCVLANQLVNAKLKIELDRAVRDLYKQLERQGIAVRKDFDEQGNERFISLDRSKEKYD